MVSGLRGNLLLRLQCYRASTKESVNRSTLAKSVGHGMLAKNFLAKNVFLVWQLLS